MNPFNRVFWRPRVEEEVDEEADETSPERVVGVRVTANYLAVMGAAPILGRTFTPDEDRATSASSC